MEHVRCISNNVVQLGFVVRRLYAMPVLASYYLSRVQHTAGCSHRFCPLGDYPLPSHQIYGPLFSIPRGSQIHTAYTPIRVFSLLLYQDVRNAYHACCESLMVDADAEM